MPYASWLQRVFTVTTQGVARMQVTMSLACGGAAGLISSTATFPLDLIRRRMQLEGQGGLIRYRGYADVARAVFRNGGFKGFYAGIIPEYYKVRLAGPTCVLVCTKPGRGLATTCIQSLTAPESCQSLSRYSVSLHVGHVSG